MAEALIESLDLAKVGGAFVNLVAVSCAAGHQHIWDTVRDYVHESPDEHPEAAFVREAFQLTASEAAAKWFGSTDAAALHAATAVAAWVESAGREPGSEWRWATGHEWCARPAHRGAGGSTRRARTDLLWVARKAESVAAT